MTLICVPYVSYLPWAVKGPHTAVLSGTVRGFYGFPAHPLRFH